MTTSQLFRDMSAGGMLLLLLAVNAQVAPAQSLGDVAQREAERRKQAAAGRVYTNADLLPGDESAPAPTPLPAEAAAPAGPATPDAPPSRVEGPPASEPGTESVNVKGREKRDEQYWRGLTKDLRGRLAKAQADIAATETRISEIDAGPQTPTVVKEREVLSVTLSKLQQTARYRSEELTRFLTRAQVAKVPEEWFQ